MAANPTPGEGVPGPQQGWAPPTQSFSRGGMNMRHLALWLGAGGFALLALGKLLEWPTRDFGLDRARFAIFVEFLGFALLGAATLLFALSKT